jgi:hypothetical protein
MKQLSAHPVAHVGVILLLSHHILALSSPEYPKSLVAFMHGPKQLLLSLYIKESGQEGFS